MTIDQWNNLSVDNRETLITAVLGSQFLALTRAERNPKEDPIIKEVLKWVSINGNVAYVNIHKTIILK